jgi:beta propeller repeat protein
VADPPRRILWITLALFFAAVGTAHGEPPGAPAEVLIRLRATGPHAITADAAEQYRRGGPLAAIARDRSDSLDRLEAELGVHAVRRVFPSARGRAARGAAKPAIPDLAPVYQLALPPGSDTSAAAARYASDPHVEWAHASVAMVPDALPNDPYLTSRGSWGQSYEDLWGILRVRAPEAWDTTQGEGVVVAVVDTGIDTAHPDLAANLWVNPGEDLDHDGIASASDFNGVDDDGDGLIDDLNGYDFANDDPDPFDDFGHGTHVAGTIAAVANNGIGVAGVAPRARLMALKGLLAEGDTPDSVLARAMVYAADHGARVINNSWSCSARCPSNPVIEEAQAYATALGVVVVTSAGNRSDDVVFFSPKMRRDNIVVGASDENDLRAPFSNVGWLLSVIAPGSGDFTTPGVFVPQRAILSTLSSGAGFDATGGGRFVIGGDYLRWAGTSMSTPHVAGIAALVLSLHPDYSPDDVRAVIRASARDLGAPGFDRENGAGLADAAAALQTPRPTVRALFLAPAPGAVVVPEDESVTIRGAVTGAAADVELAVGSGPDPEQFNSIPLTEPVPAADGELARWDVAAREDGPYVLRLSVRGADGSSALEFLPLSLERNAPRRLSSPGAAAHAPAISGDRVVWESARPQGDVDLGLELFANDWPSGREWRVVTGDGDQHAARISGDRLAWLDARGAAAEVASCRVGAAGTPCRAQTAAAGSVRREGLDLSGDSLVWSEGEVGAERLRGCRFGGGACRPLAMPVSAVRQLDPVLRGDRLWWRERSAQGTGAVYTCTGFPDRCEPTALASVRTESAFAASESRMSWSGFFDPIPVFVCRVTAPGVCPRRQIGAFAGGEAQLAIDRHRVVWSAGGPGGDLDVYFCEDDPLTGACPVQRLTGSAADQRNPEISGTRVVWEDDRDGPSAIFGLELPSLDPIGDRRAAVGRTLRIAVRGRDPAGGVLALSATFADGTPLADRGAAFTDHGDGTGVLTWTPRADDVGSYVVTFAGRSSGHLSTRASAQVAVQAGR